MTKKIVVTDHGFDELSAARAVSERTGAQLVVHQAQDEAETASVANGADVLLVRYAPITRKVLQALNPNAVVVRYGIGFDNVDVAAAADLSIRVANVPDYGVDTVADHTVALLLGCLRRVHLFDAAVRQTRDWVSHSALGPISALDQTAVGILGTGRIGRAVAARMSVFGCRLIGHDPYADPADLVATGIEAVSLADLAERSDAVTVHVPLSAETTHLVDTRFLARMKPTAVLVNTARGALVDSAALAAALESGRLAVAALDVVEPEPLPASSPLWDTPNLLLTPHVAWYSEQSNARLERLAAEEAERAVLGRPLRQPVTPSPG